MTERVMVDIETLGREPGCVVVSIGAVRFGYGIKDELDLDVAPTSCQRAGLDIDAETLAWWLTQGEAARSQLLGGQPLAEALDELASFIPAENKEVWAKSPAFDLAILEAAFEAVGQPTPWEFYETRDVRTIVNLECAVDIDHQGIEHDAVDDARFQARQVGETLMHIDAEVGDE